MIIGICLAIIPMSILTVLCSIVMTGSFWDIPLPIQECNNKNDDPLLASCALSMFDNIPFQNIIFED